MDKLNSIKRSYTKLSVPAKTAKQHGDFNEILNNYSIYCEQFKPVLTKLEEAGSNPDALMEVNTDLEELYIRLQEINASYNEYKDLYDKDKDTYMNIDNL
jgi:DNA repair ATPase RecN